MGHNNPGRARREIARDNERLSRMTDEERRKEQDAEELAYAKSQARNEAYQSFSKEERVIYTKIRDAMAMAESRAFNSWYRTKLERENKG
ncbi:hypothetical protein [Bradyrhizobium elkanii]